MDYWRGGGGGGGGGGLLARGGGAKGMLPFPSKIIGGWPASPPPVPTPMKGYKANFKYFMPRMVCTDECGTK